MFHLIEREEVLKTINKILSNPNYKPPENLFELELNLNEGLRGLLRSPGVSKETLVRFSIGEAELTLPIFEAQHPGDSRPRDAIQTTRDWFSNPAADVADAVRAAARAAAAAYAAAAAARAAAAAARAAWADAAAYAAAWAAAVAARAAADARATAASATKAAYWAREADPRVTEEHQILRFLELLKVYNVKC